MGGPARPGEIVLARSARLGLRSLSAWPSGWVRWASHARATSSSVTTCLARAQARGGTRFRLPWVAPWPGPESGDPSSFVRLRVCWQRCGPGRNAQIHVSGGQK